MVAVNNTDGGYMTTLATAAVWGGGDRRKVRGASFLFSVDRVWAGIVILGWANKK
jgi:hypothetical protein